MILATLQDIDILKFCDQNIVVLPQKKKKKIFEKNWIFAILAEILKLHLKKIFKKFLSLNFDRLPGKIFHISMPFLAFTPREK